MAFRFAHMPMRATYINYTTIVCNDVTDYWYESPRSVNVSFSENSRDFVEAAGTYAFLGLIPPPASSPSIQPTPSIEPTSSPGRTLTIENQPTDNNYYLWTAVGGIAVIIVVLSVGLFIAVKRSKYQEIVSDYKSINEREDDFMTQSTPFLNESNLIPMRELKKLKQIEKGSFGTIYKATWHGTKIAVKKLSSTMSSQLLKEFYEEAALMRELRHPNILQYLGIPLPFPPFPPPFLLPSPFLFPLLLSLPSPFFLFTFPLSLFLFPLPLLSLNMFASFATLSLSYRPCKSFLSAIPFNYSRMGLKKYFPFFFFFFIV